MAKKDLAWFPFFIEAWLGGTLSMSQGEIGAYLLALIQQWKSGDMQAIRDTPRTILTICRGKMSAEVRSKFVRIEIEGAAYLRNARLHEIYIEQTTKHKQRVERAASGAQAKHKQTISTPQADHRQPETGAEADRKHEFGGAPSTQNKELRSLSTGGEESQSSGVESNKEIESSTNMSGKPDVVRGDPREVFDHWKLVHDHPRAVFDEKRRKLIRARLKEHSVADLKLAVEGCKKSPHHQGETNGTIYDSIQLIFRDTEHVERFMAFATGQALVEVVPKRFQTDAEKLAASDALYASYGAA